MEFEGRTEQEAVHAACAALNLAEEDLDYTVVDEGSGGVFGLGARPVQIRVRAPKGNEGDAPSSGSGDSMVESVDESKGITGPAPEKAKMAEEVAEGLARRMGLEAAKVSVRDEDAQIVVVIEEGEEGATEVGEILGRSRPPAIPSFQFLLNKIVNRFPEDRKHIVVEVPSVPRRERQAEVGDAEERRAPPQLDPDLDPTLVALARSLAEKAKTLGKVVTVHPMLPADRRAIHQTLGTIDGVSSVSEGEGLYRRMHVVPDALRGGSGKKRRRRRRRRGKKQDGGDGGDGGNSDEAGGNDGGGELQDTSA